MATQMQLSAKNANFPCPQLLQLLIQTKADWFTIFFYKDFIGDCGGTVFLSLFPPWLTRTLLLDSI